FQLTPARPGAAPPHPITAQLAGARSVGLRSLRSLNGQPQRAGDHEPLDLARALPDLEDLGVAVEAAHWRVVDESVAAEDLGGLARRGDRRLRRIQLCHRRSLLERTAG